MIAEVQKAITQGVMKDLKKAGFSKSPGKGDFKQKSEASTSKSTQSASSKRKHKKITSFLVTSLRRAWHGVLARW